MMVTVSFLMTNESTDWSLTSSEVLAVIYAVSYQNFKSVSSFMYSSLIIAYDFGLQNLVPVNCLHGISYQFFTVW
jgi:hypothetical protein